jgi:hypothetical protein
MNAQILIQAVIQQTTVFLAQLATAGRLRAPLMQVNNQVFLDLSAELQNQGLKKNVIADMFGMTLRTYHRKVRELSQSKTVEGRSIWEAVLEFVRQRERVSAQEIEQRFARDDRDVVAGVLSDLVDSGFCSRTGRGPRAVYRLAPAADFAEDAENARGTAQEYLVWQTVFHHQSLDITRLVTLTRLSEEVCRQALDALIAAGRVERSGQGTEQFTSAQLDVPVGQSEGWEAAIFDHFQAVLSALCAKLALGENRAERSDATGGATYALDLWPGHPLEQEALGSLEKVRVLMDDLRMRVDRVTAEQQQKPSERLTFYVGQHWKNNRDGDFEA